MFGAVRQQRASSVPLANAGYMLVTTRHSARQGPAIPNLNRATVNNRTELSISAYVTKYPSVQTLMVRDKVELVTYMFGECLISRKGR